MLSGPKGGGKLTLKNLEEKCKGTTILKTSHYVVKHIFIKGSFVKMY